MPIKTINDPVFRIRITFIFDEPKDKALAFLKKWTGDDLSHMWHCSGFVCSSDGYKQEFYLVLPDTQESNWLVTSILAHECLHITARVLRTMDVQLTESSEEAFTYYLTWLMEELTIIFNGHKKRAKPMKAKASAKKTVNQFTKKNDMKAIKASVKKSSDKRSKGK